MDRWILARLRHHIFFSLAELNQAIAKLLDDLNKHPFQGRKESRKDLFEAIDRHVLRPLPQDDYEYAEWRRVKPGIDYHVEADLPVNMDQAIPLGLITNELVTNAMKYAFPDGRTFALQPH